MPAEKNIVVIPGLGDDLKWTAFWLKFWNTPEAHIHVVSAEWGYRYGNDYNKTDLLKRKLAEIVAGGEPVGVVAISASASLALRVMREERGLINKMVNIAGRLTLPSTGLPTLDPNIESHPVYRSIVRSLDDNQKLITDEYRQRVMTLRGMYDEQVPVSTIPLEGATNVRMPVIGHYLSITTALTAYHSRIINFLLS